MRVQKHPHPLTPANTWPTLAAVPAGLETEEMTQAEYDAWLAEQPPTPEPPPPVPEEVTQRQFRLALIDFGIDPDALTADFGKISDKKTRQKALAELEFAGHIRRDHPLVAQFAAARGMTSAQVDALFRAASLYA